ncbi:MAG: ATP-binding cassette domain-containing protein [Candidatus Nanoarchaeia archaeon]|jgi:energy-coupling factor transport system ATP-binding protein
MISVNNLTFTYPIGVTALRNINLEIKQGEVVAIIGQNGSGKTTLVKHFNGLLLPTTGDVLINGKSTFNSTTAQLSREVGYVFQNPDDQIFNNTVFDEVAFGPKNLGLNKREVSKRVNDALEVVGLSAVKRKHPLDLDLNQKKLVAIASILAMHPQVLILDEPTTGQDHEGLIRVESLIKTLRKDHTIIMISHDMGLVARAADRVVMMCNGGIIFDGSPREAFTKNDLLKRTYLQPPLVTQLSQSLGLKKDVLTIDEFIDSIHSSKPRSKV